MPEISRFFGIVIRMFYAEHGIAHFHALYGEAEAVIAIDSLEVIAGSLPTRALGMVLEWAAAHRAELREDWSLMRRSMSPRPIPPLE